MAELWPVILFTQCIWMVRPSRSVDPYKTLQNLVFGLDCLPLVQQLLEISAGNKMDMVICLVSYDKEWTLGTLGKTFSWQHFEIFFLFFLENMPASVAQLMSVRLETRRSWVWPRRGQQHSFMEIDHEIFSMGILSLPLIQEGQLSFAGERMCTILVNRLEDKACPVNMLSKLTMLDMTSLG